MMTIMAVIELHLNPDQICRACTFIGEYYLSRNEGRGGIGVRKEGGGEKGREGKGKGIGWKGGDGGRLLKACLPKVIIQPI